MNATWILFPLCLPAYARAIHMDWDEERCWAQCPSCGSAIPSETLKEMEIPSPTWDTLGPG